MSGTGTRPDLLDQPSRKRQRRQSTGRLIDGGSGEAGKRGNTVIFAWEASLNNFNTAVSESRSIDGAWSQSRASLDSSLNSTRIDRIDQPKRKRRRRRRE
jgi:hypothetical protein